MIWTLTVLYGVYVLFSIRSGYYVVTYDFRLMFRSLLFNHSHVKLRRQLSYGSHHKEENYFEHVGSCNFMYDHNCGLCSRYDQHHKKFREHPYQLLFKDNISLLKGDTRQDQQQHGRTHQGPTSSMIKVQKKAYRLSFLHHPRGNFRMSSYVYSYT